jgi:hypothetical protein
MSLGWSLARLLEGQFAVAIEESVAAIDVTCNRHVAFWFGTGAAFLLKLQKHRSRIIPILGLHARGLTVQNYHVDPIIGKFRCLVCGQKIDCRESEGLEFARQNSWPECCNQIMRLFGDDQGTDDWKPILSAEQDQPQLSK